MGTHAVNPICQMQSGLTREIAPTPRRSRLMPKPADVRDTSIRTYRSKRDFTITAEPPPGAPKPGSTAPLFVVQKHVAKRAGLHWDLRLEHGGVLWSWAVRKGPSLDPADRRLSAHVEDHPLEYAEFEGVIGAGYGSGAVIVWDAGTYRNLDEDRSMAEALDAGHARIWLEGEKLRGGWTLHRTNAGAKPQWLLMKRRDEGADARRNPQSTQPESVKTGRTVEEVAGGGEE
jgi:DNA ligase D-like protein (predicted 3'-phosphoesterase)